VKLSGKMTARHFDNLQDVKGTVHVAVAGPAIHGSLDELDVSTLFGELVETTIDLGGSTRTTTGIPEGVSLGLAENMFKGDFAVNVDPGIRTLWNVGGNVVLSDVLGALSQAAKDDDVTLLDADIDYGAALSALLPVLGRLQAGALPFQPVTEPGGLDGLKLGTLLRLQARVKTPDLVPYQLHGESVRPDIALIVGGVHEQTQGFVPRGFSAGVDKNENGKVDAIMGNTDEGEVALRIAPSSNGLEESPTQVVALAGRLDRLFSSDPSVPRILSASVARPGPLLFKNNATNSVTLPSVLSVPDNVQLSDTSFTQSGVAGATLHRLDIGDWSVYFPALANTVDLTGVPMSEKVSLHSMRLGLKSGVDYQSLIRFDGDDIDDLSEVMDSFSIRSLTSQDITQ
jgi:hypothetical protein